MRILRTALASTALGLLGTVPVTAQELSAGDPAPPISVTEWVQGEAVPAFEKGKIYLLEFWATW